MDRMICQHFQTMSRHGELKANAIVEILAILIFDQNPIAGISWLLQSHEERERYRRIAMGLEPMP